MIIFENIDTKETVGIDQKSEGKFYRAKLSAIMNMSNMSVNADRGQDFGWRLQPEQQAIIENWENDPQMIDRVSSWSKVMIDDLSHSEFLAYLLYQQELGVSPEKSNVSMRRDQQRDYEKRVAMLRENKPEAMPAFDSSIARGEATVDDFLRGGVTGDASGDKVEEPSEVTDALADLDKVLAETGNSMPVRPEVVAVDPAKAGEDKTVVVENGELKAPASDGKTSTAKKPAKK